jgi:hypothetical protein
VNVPKSNDNANKHPFTTQVTTTLARKEMPRLSHSMSFGSGAGDTNIFNGRSITHCAAHMVALRL